MAEYAKEITDIAFRTGEGWLIPGEIISWIKSGINAHLIVQPFACLPNHITGRGVAKAIKEKYPESTILSLDFDPDTSVANIHNRMQMIILNAR
jgi:predicted nucleotide-binding protein (sugar kinase/HSP70/actin superfamily)